MTKLTRDEWKRQYAARLMERSGMAELPAIECAEEAATDDIFRWNEMHPEDAADQEMSCWENDEGEAA